MLLFNNLVSMYCIGLYGTHMIKYVINLIELLHKIQGIITVLQTPPQARTPEDIEFLQKETQEIAFFKNYIEKGDPDGNTNNNHSMNEECAERI